MENKPTNDIAFESDKIGYIGPIPPVLTAACMHGNFGVPGCGALYASDTGDLLHNLVAIKIAEIHISLYPDHEVAVIKRVLPL